jgi:tRNA dimethylallyltransferase
VTGSPPLIVVAGATATGKTELGIRLAETYLAAGRRAVIISADSRQVYRGLDIGTAKVGEPDRARVEHRGLDLVDPDQPFSVADFVAHAWRCWSAGPGCTCAPSGTASTRPTCRTTR